MAGKAQILGRAQVRANGVFFDSAPGAVLQPGGIQNNNRSSNWGFRYNQTYLAALLTCSIPLAPGLSLRDLQNMTDVEITFTADTGQVWIITNAAQTGQVKATDGADAGYVDLQFEGDAAQEDIS